jgi:hypothetical protein
VGRRSGAAVGLSPGAEFPQSFWLTFSVTTIFNFFDPTYLLSHQRLTPATRPPDPAQIFAHVLKHHPDTKFPAQETSIEMKLDSRRRATLTGIHAPADNIRFIGGGTRRIKNPIPCRRGVRRAL